MTFPLLSIRSIFDYGFDIDLVTNDNWIEDESDDHIMVRHYTNEALTDTFKLQVGWLGRSWLSNVGTLLADAPKRTQAKRHIRDRSDAVVPFWVERCDVLRGAAMTFFVQNAMFSSKTESRKRALISITISYAMNSDTKFSGTYESRYINGVERAHLKEQAQNLLHELERIHRARAEYWRELRLSGQLQFGEATTTSISRLPTRLISHERHVDA